MNERASVGEFAYRRARDQDAAAPVHHPVVVVGAGPVGLVAAIDLAQRGIPVVILDDANRIGEGSRAICFAKRSLEIFDRLGVGDRMMAKGVTWQRGIVFLGDQRLFQYDLLPEPAHRRPAFINLQQFYVEQYLTETAAATPNLDLRWSNRLVDVTPHDDGVLLSIETPDGPYALSADWLIAADGVRSSIRGRLGLPFEGRTFADRFLIADIRMKGDRANERLFWFAPHFYDGQSALMHRQPDDVWRIDLQLDADADPKREQSPEVVVPRLERMLGHRDFELVWTSVYQYQCRRLERFVHERVIFVGDAAHQVTPFGARGANSGIQDAENLSWKLALVIRGLAKPRLIDSYDTERSAAADENIAHSSNAADFVVPRSVGERRLRDAVLELARTENFAQRMVNSGRASTAAAYDSPLSTPDTDEWTSNLAPGAMIPDAPLRNGTGQPVWLAELMGRDFNLLTFAAGDFPDLPPGLNRLDVGRDIEDGEGLFQTRFDATPGCGYLVRPDMHLAARWRDVARAPVATALARATGAEMATP